MDFQQGARPAREAGQVTETSAPRRSGGMLRGLLTVVIVLVVLAAIFFGARAAMAASGNAGVKTKQYQAVFLSNGQVYFGKLTNVSSDYLKLTDIYYLQVQQAVQPGSTSSSTSNSNQQVSLAKLGGELHGPEDEMFVARDQVLFWENLKDDGKVVQAIKNYQATGSNK